MASAPVIGQKREIRVKARATLQGAFVKRYVVPSDYSFPEKFDLSKNSILFAESMRGGEYTFLFLYWSSAERARDLEPKIEKELCIRGGDIVGNIIQVVTPESPKWLETPAKWGQWLVTAGAIFGALSVVQDHFTDLFGRPNVVIFASDKVSPSYHAGDTIDLAIKVQNQAASGHVEVRIDGVELKPLDPTAPRVAVKSAISNVPQIQAGQSPEIHLSGLPAAIQASKVHHYSVSVQATAREGMFWPSAKIESVPYEIQLWPDRMVEFSVHRISQTVVQVECSVGSGVALDKGLLEQVTLTSTAIPVERDITLEGAQTVDSLVVPGSSGSLASVRFQTGSLRAFRPIRVTLTIPFQKPLTEEQWSELQKSTEVLP